MSDDGREGSKPGLHQGHKKKYKQTTIGQIYRSVIFRIKGEAISRKRYIPASQRCLECTGLGVDKNRLDSVSLNPDFYKCPECMGSGRREI